MTTIKIPTVEQAEAGALTRLFKSRKWEKAALVWAFTINEGRGGDQRSNLKSEVRFPMTMAEFAQQGYSGLSSEQTVAHYRKAWQSAIDANLASSVKPGDKIDEPDMDWPPNADPHLHTAGFESAEDRAAEIRRLQAEVGGAKGAIRVATSSPGTLQVVAQTATDEQAKALVEGLRRRGVDQSETYVQSLSGDTPAKPIAEQVREALSDPEVAAQVVADDASRAQVRKALDERYDAAPKPVPLTPRAPGSEPMELVHHFRQIHRTVDQAVQLVLDGDAVISDEGREALLREIAWLRSALDHIESGLNAGSLDAELRAFQEEQL